MTGNRGIGAAIARRLAPDGVAVALTYAHSADKSRAVGREIDADGGRALVIRSGKRRSAAPAAAVEEAVRMRRARGADRHRYEPG